MILEGFRCYFSSLLDAVLALIFEYVLCLFLVMRSDFVVANGMAMLGFLYVAILFGSISDVLDGRGWSLAAFADVCLLCIWSCVFCGLLKQCPPPEAAFFTLIVHYFSCLVDPLFRILYHVSHFDYI